MSYKELLRTWKKSLPVDFSSKGDFRIPTDVQKDTRYLTLSDWLKECAWLSSVGFSLYSNIDVFDNAIIFEKVLKIIDRRVLINKKDFLEWMWQQNKDDDGRAAAKCSHYARSINSEFLIEEALEEIS